MRIASESLARLEGFVDTIQDGWVLGWAWSKDKPLEPIEVRVLIDGHEAGRALAGLYRADLERAGKGNGKHAFEVRLPDTIGDGPHTVRVIGPDGRDLTGSPAQIGAAASPGSSDDRSTSAGARYTSPFGGLWPDLSNADAVIAGKRALGWISDEEAELLRAWKRDGFVILPQAVAREDIERLDEDVERIWARNSTHRYFVEFWENDTKSVRLAGPEFRDRSVKLLDLFAGSAAALRVTFAPAVLRFLSIIFERPALAFQSLYFRWGSRQDVHQDSAFVRVSSPREFAASWVALEDIQERSGELEYFAGSHLLEDHLFEGVDKWMPFKSPDYRLYVDSLRSRCVERGLEHRLFRPRKGDVLLWHADLAHGGSSIVTPGVTRKSLVTHFCPTDCSPQYSDAGRAPVRHRFNELASYSYPARE
jgi:phytanoyl-CoA hydroxylase